MNFSVIPLFKVNLMPGGAADEESKFSRSDIDKVKQLLAIEKVECRYESAEQAIERENEFVNKYNEDLLPLRQNRIDEVKERQERKSIV